jgi:DNA-directed RNA polymerase beta' subunit
MKRKRDMTLENKVITAINRARRMKRLFELNAPECIQEMERALFHEAAEAVFIGPDEGQTWQ